MISSHSLVSVHHEKLTQSLNNLFDSLVHGEF